MFSSCGRMMGEENPSGTETSFLLHLVLLSTPSDHVCLPACLGHVLSPCCCVQLLSVLTMWNQIGGTPAVSTG